MKTERAEFVEIRSLFLVHLCVEINPQFYWGKKKTLVYKNLLVVK